MSRAPFFRLLAAVLALLFAFLAAEVALRLVPQRGFRTAPVAERWDWVEPGERRSRATPEVPLWSSGSFRLVTVGDSFTWGEGVYPEDTWSARLERRLGAARPGLAIERFNLSRPGWNSFQQHWWLRREIDRLAPDLVVVGFCLNDAEPFDEDELIGARQVLGDLANGAPAASTRRGPSVLVERLRSSWRNLTSRRRVRAYYHSLYGEAPGWQRARAALAGMARLSSEHGFPLLLVVFPVFDSQLDERYPYRDLHAAVADAGAEAGLRVLDLLPFYQGVDARRLAVTPFTDPHPNELAHRIAADAIAAHLVDREIFRRKETP